MGRGRQKAKQTKVARKLKYYSPETDYAQLERELSGKSNLSTEEEYENTSSMYGWEDYDPDQEG
ncbi:DUF3073 domain-containing protein [Actinomyces sp. zg-332]|uniref:DUF3073 domain-containing protein n=1 Tax=Actinomyces sp. zg-332 TaxID=2708340 RepID=UPI001423163C|nr:DUF3073 domain-containing protein [Actinomyces sp. zg-332]QPK94195.1 DUF3073 domain-containing protein [Actinomyces sp. zg-332]